MLLRTLGQLELQGSDFKRLKPLALLAYLSLEGPKTRRRLAELFWPGARDAMNSLSVALSQLKRGVPNVAVADDERVSAQVQSDALLILQHYEQGDYEAAVERYHGVFMEGVDLEFGEELEEWVFTTRERLGDTVREALLRIAEDRASLGNFDEAGTLAGRAYELPGSRPPEPELLVRLHMLLTASRTPALNAVKREAESLGISLRLTAEEARAKLRKVLIGRERELERLAGLSDGQWAWVRGGPGMGKTTLLKHLQGTYLPGRSGLPYATLEPVLSDFLGDSDSVMLRRVAGSQGMWLLDDFELADAESRRLLSQLKTLHTRLKVVIASTDPPGLPVDVDIGLRALPAEALSQFPDAWEKTGGLPELLGAHLREEPLEPVLERRLGRLSEPARQVYFALVITEEADAALVRRALGLDNTTIGNALDELLASGLIEASGVARARPSALRYLQEHPRMLGSLALKLARELPDVPALPLFRMVRPLWEERDVPAVIRAYCSWAQELIRRGFAAQAAEILAEAPPSQQAALLRARALERAGQFKEALDVLSLLDEADSATVFALKSALLWRLGRPEEASQAATMALGGDSEARAEALNTLGVLARSAGKHSDAARYARRSAALWRILGNQGRWVDTLNNLAIAQTLAGDDGDPTFQEALDAAGANALLQARTLLNLGWAQEYHGDGERAEDAYRSAANLAEQAGALSTSAWAWNNLGVLHHKRGQSEQARNAYEEALSLARRVGEQRILGVVMANLGELTEDQEAWEEALRILEQSGHGTLAEDYRSELPEKHPFKTVL